MKLEAGKKANKKNKKNKYIAICLFFYYYIIMEKGKNPKRRKKVDIKTTRESFNDSIILGGGYCCKIYNFFHYDLSNKSNNYYNCGYYGWNWSIEELDLIGLKHHVYIINTYRNSPRKWAAVNYERLESKLLQIIKQYDKIADGKSWGELDKIKKRYRNRIVKILNNYIDEDVKNWRF